MTVQPTLAQHKIAARADLYFRTALDNRKLKSMFRGEATGLTVGLAYSERTHHFIVREIVPAAATAVEIDEVCARLITALALSYANLMQIPLRWGH